MLKTISAFALVLALAPACGGSAKKTSEPTPVTEETPPVEETPPAGDADAKLTEAQCTEALDHAIALFRADPNTAEVAEQIEAEKPTHVEECLKTGTKHDYDCLMAATSYQELGQCEEPEPVE